MQVLRITRRSGLVPMAAKVALHTGSIVSKLSAYCLCTGPSLWLKEGRRSIFIQVVILLLGKKNASCWEQQKTECLITTWRLLPPERSNSWHRLPLELKLSRCVLNFCSKQGEWFIDSSKTPSSVISSALGKRLSPSMWHSWRNSKL